MSPGMGACLQLNPALNGGGSAYLEVFNHLGSLFHIGLGAVAAVVPPEWAVVLLAGFAAYELGRLAAGKCSASVAGAFAEFAAGMGGYLLAKNAGWA